MGLWRPRAPDANYLPTPTTREATMMTQSAFDTAPVDTARHGPRGVVPPAAGRQRLSAGLGAKGQRFYDWAWIDLPAPIRSDAAPPGIGCW